MFLKREYQFSEPQGEVLHMPAAAKVQLEDEDSGGGGERAGNEDDEEVKQFNLKTVYDDEKVIRGYLYKTAQSIGLF